METPKTSKILYCAVVLTEVSHDQLVAHLRGLGLLQDHPETKVIAHHMTIAFGKSLEDEILDQCRGKEITLHLEAYGSFEDKVSAVRVKGHPFGLKNPHITVSCNPTKGGRPVMANNITDWSPIDRFEVRGVIMDVTAND